MLNLRESLGTAVESVCMVTVSTSVDCWFRGLTSVSGKRVCGVGCRPGFRNWAV